MHIVDVLSVDVLSVDVLSVDVLSKGKQAEKKMKKGGKFLK